MLMANPPKTSGLNLKAYFFLKMIRVIMGKYLKVTIEENSMDSSKLQAHGWIVSGDISKNPLEMDKKVLYPNGALYHFVQF